MGSSLLVEKPIPKRTISNIGMHDSPFRLICQIRLSPDSESSLYKYLTAEDRIFLRTIPNALLDTHLDEIFTKDPRHHR